MNRAATLQPSSVTSSVLRASAPSIDGYDQRQRYGLVALLIDRLFRSAGRGSRVLEVGSNTLDLLSTLLDPNRVRVTRCDLFEGDPTDLNYVQLELGRGLPFADDSFDTVVSLDTLEHVPAAERRTFLAECLRVARLGVIVTCPDGRPDVEQAEAVANAAFQARHGHPHPFLSEHQQFGLPRENEVRELFRDLGAPHAVFPNSPLDLWLGRMVFDEIQHESQRGNSGRRPGWRPLPGGPQPYRKVYVAVKAFDASEALDPLPATWFERNEPDDRTAINAGSADVTAHAVNRMATDFARQLADLRDDANRDRAAIMESARKEIEREVGQRRSANLQHVMVSSALASVLRSPAHRFLNPLRRIKNWIRPARFTASALLPWAHLSRGAAGTKNEWQASGHDPQFVVPCCLPAGWVRLKLRMTRRNEDRPRKETAEIYTDYGDGFRADTCLARFTWFAGLDEDVHLFLPKPVFGFRFDPIDGMGEFRLDELTMESVTGPRAWAAAFGRKLGLLRAFRCMGPALSRGLSDLLHGRFGLLRRKLFQGLHDDRTLKACEPSMDHVYDRWRACRALNDDDRAKLRAEAAGYADPPVFSVIMPVCDPPVECLQKAIDSVRRQIYPHWQLCIADDASTRPEVLELLRSLAVADPRISVTFRATRGGISAASNDALAAATGRYIALLDHDDEIAEHALSLFAREVVAHPTADFLYSDEDKIEPDGRHVTPFLKPDWSPEFFLSCMYTCHLGVYRTALVRQVGGFRSEFDQAQDYDLALRVVAAVEQTDSVHPKDSILPPHAERIRHVPDVLYHWRKLPTSTATGNAAKPDAEKVARRAIEAYLSATGRDAWVEPGPTPGYHRVRSRILGRPKVSIVIPTAGKPATIRGKASSYLGHCVESIRRTTTYDRYEIVVVDNGDLTPELAAQIDQAGVRRFHYESSGPFNLADKMNQGADHATGDLLVFLNDDIEVISADWLEAMLEHAQQPGVGAVGAKLLFLDGRLQHVGVTLLEGRPGHPFYQFPRTYPGYYNGAIVPRNYSAVTGACVMIPTEVFREVGGFDPIFPLNYNDVDLCLRIVASGRRIVWTPYAELYHFESVSKSDPPPGELERFLTRWAGAIPTDPYYHPLLTMHYHDYRLGEAG